MPSGSRSVGGTAIMASLPPVAGIVVIAPGMSLAAAGAGGVACGGTAIPALSTAFRPEAYFDCFSTGVGEIIKGAGVTGNAGCFALSAGAGACTGAAGSLECSIIGSCSTLPVSSSVIAILNVPSTITTTLAPTSSERILEEMFEAFLSSALALSPPLSLGAAFAERPAFSGGGAAAAACAARRAAAMKLDELTGSFGPEAISLIAFSEAAIR